MPRTGPHHRTATLLLALALLCVAPLASAATAVPPVAPQELLANSCAMLWCVRIGFYTLPLDSVGSCLR